MPETFTIESEEMPSKSVSVTFVEPTFKDRREASKRYPTSERVGYSMEELLLSMCLTGFNGTPFSSAPRDPINYLRELNHADGQYLLSTFLSMFTLDVDQAKETKEIGFKMKISPETTHSVKKGILPVSGKSFTFLTPTLGDRMHLDQIYPGADSNCGYTLEEMMFSAALTNIDGDTVEPTKDYIARIDDWPHLDAQFALAIFLGTVTIDKADDAKAKSLGKSLRSKTKDTKPLSTKASTEKKAKEDTTT